MVSTLGQYLSFKKTIDSVGVKIRAVEDTDLEYSVYLSDYKDDEGKKLKIYSSSISMTKSAVSSWMSLPVNMYLDSDQVQIELKKNAKVIVDDETWCNPNFAFAFA